MTQQGAAHRGRVAFVIVMLFSSVMLIAWIGILASTLPDHHSDKQWKAAWVGFDIALVIGMLVTAVGAWKRRQFVAISCIVTASLLFCDAWFDMVLSWDTDNQWWAILMAAFAELPFGAYLFWAATRIIRRGAETALRAAGYEGPMPSLWKLSLGHFTPADPVTDPVGAIEESLEHRD